MSHCGVCGTSHESYECPIEAFAYIYCTCGNGFPIPEDALGMPFGYCGQCGSDGDWNVRKATKEDFNGSLPHKMKWDQQNE